MNCEVGQTDELRREERVLCLDLLTVKLSYMQLAQESEVPLLTTSVHTFIDNPF